MDVIIIDETANTIGFQSLGEPIKYCWADDLQGWNIVNSEEKVIHLGIGHQD